MLIVLGLLALAGISAGIFSRSGGEDVFLANSWRELPAPEDLAISIAFIVGSYLVFRFAPRRLRWLGMGFSAAASLRYITWRATTTLNFTDGANGTACVLLFAAEVYTVILLFLGHFQTFRLKDRSTPRVPDGTDWPSVDVFITTYDESVDIVRRTLVGCTDLRYPGKKKVWILDDGKRLEMKRLAERFGAGYLSRDDNQHAKAGNLNEAMKKTDGEFIAQFDADHVPVRSFLEETVPFFFGEEDLALVQTPHHFHNPDVFQRNLIVSDQIANEQDLFFQVLQPGNDYWNAAFFCGSNAVLRRAAIADVGGFATETITEDAHTALRMHSKGWKSAYFNRILAGGVTAETFSDALTQRLRWGMGMIGILKVDNPLTKKGLKLAQRICYFASSFFFFFGIPRLIFFLAPMAFLFFGIRPIDASILPVAALYLPHILAGWMVTSGVSRNYRHTFWSEVYESSMAFYMATATLWALFTKKKLPFKVTPKEVHRDSLVWSIKPAIPSLVLLIGAVASIAWGLRLYGTLTPEHSGVLAMNFLWISYNIILLVAGILVTVDRPQQRGAPRLPVYMPAKVAWNLDGKNVEVEGVALDLSEGGAKVMLRHSVPADVDLSVTLSENDVQIKLPARQAYSHQAGDTGAFGASLRFTEVSEDEQEQLIRWMYTAPDTWLKLKEPAQPLQAFMKLAGSALRWTRTHEYPLHRSAARFERHIATRLFPIADAKENPSMGGPPIDVELLDLSQGGAMVRPVKGKLEEGMHCRIEVPLGASKTITLSGKILRRQAHGHCALVFEDLTEAKRADLLWHLFVEPLHASGLKTAQPSAKIESVEDAVQSPGSA